MLISRAYYCSNSGKLSNGPTVELYNATTVVMFQLTSSRAFLSYSPRGVRSLGFSHPSTARSSKP